MIFRKPNTGSGFDPATLRFVLLAAFIACVFFMGGGSRGDIQSLAFLRPLAIAFAAWALIVINRQEWRRLGVPFALLLALAALMAAQLVPLPPALWQRLPGRETINDLGTLLGMADIWRPLTLAPSRTLNSLFALVVPVAAFLLVAVQHPAMRRNVLLLFLVAAGVTTIWAMMQLSGSSHNAFYLYRITNDGQPVGLFANRNHQAAFLACATLMWAWFLGGIDIRQRFAASKLAVAIGGYLLCLALLVVTGSRAGLILEAVLTPLALWFVTRSDFIRSGLTFGRFHLSRGAIVGGFVIMLAVLVGAMVLLSRSAAIDRLAGMFGDAEFEDLRSTLTGILVRMAGDFFPFGSGFGSFEYVYRIYEPAEILTRRYVNQAHNDLAQFLIEGGALAAILLAGFAAWFVRRLAWTLRLADGQDRDRLVLCLALVVLIGVASLLDYPLRTPAMMAFFAAVCGLVEAHYRDHAAGQPLADNLAAT